VNTGQREVVKCTAGVNTGQRQDVECTAGVNTGQRQDAECTAGVNTGQCQNVKCMLVHTQCTVIGAAIAQSVWLVDFCLDGLGFESRSSQEIFFLNRAGRP
jgi:hypothetical protein